MEERTNTDAELRGQIEKARQLARGVSPETAERLTAYADALERQLKARQEQP
jgi:hypothetical protein